jgi:hypothetical protein
MPLEKIAFHPSRIRKGLRVLEGLQTLRTIRAVGVFFDVDDVARAENAGGAAALATFVLGIPASCRTA